MKIINLIPSIVFFILCQAAHSFLGDNVVIMNAKSKVRKRNI